MLRVLPNEPICSGSGGGGGNEDWYVRFGCEVELASLLEDV